MAGGFFDTGPLQAADDMVRLVANGITFGGADSIASALGEQDSAAKTAAAAQRAGIAGDIGKVLGWGGGAKAAVKGVTMAPKLLKAAVSKKGAAAGAVGLGSLISYNERTQPAVAKQPAPKPKPKAQAKAAQPQAQADKVAERVMKNLDQADQQLSPYEEMVRQVAEAQGGMISPRQMMALGETVQRITPKAGKPMSPRDQATARLMSIYDAQHQQGVIDDDEYTKRYESLQKINPIEEMIRYQMAEGQEE